VSTEAADSADPGRVSLRLWLRLLACANLIEKTVRARLAAEFSTTLPRFDVLATLEQAPDGLQLGELSRLLRVSNGNVTGIIARLTREGLVDRKTQPSDGRVVRVSLTPAGRAAFGPMARAHEAWIEELTQGFDAADQETLLELLTRLRRTLARSRA
jgi:DNA-binding MarR family transcriptional regulator